MRINFKGRLVDEPEIRAGFIGCGSHAFRNLFPVFQFAPVNLVATCDLDRNKAEAFARKFGADAAYANHREMLDKESLDAVFICTTYDDNGRPRYPALASDCLAAGCHVWTEKPPAASCREIEEMQADAKATGRYVAIGLKKMFFPANEKAKELMDADTFGSPQLVQLQYPVAIPTVDQFARYASGQMDWSTRNFLDHLCHPASLLIFLMGMPETLFYQRSSNGAGVATLAYSDGAVATISMTAGASKNGGMERTLLISDAGQHITIENNTRVCLHRYDHPGYGDVPSYYNCPTEKASVVWEPEFSLGQLYNKGLFLLGYYNEINAFAQAVLNKQAPVKGTLEHAWQVTRLFEAFAEGPDRLIRL